MAATKISKKTQEKLDSSLAETYNKFKEFEGKRYTGVKIGRGHKWYYDQGIWKERKVTPDEWKEKKITPDEWEINYAVKKRRAGKAPEGSGVPVGTSYHWYILAHQNVCKLDANSYTTAMTGLKYKLAFKRADKEKWNASEKAQRKRLIKLLTEVIEHLKKDEEIVPVTKEKSKLKELKAV